MCSSHKIPIKVILKQAAILVSHSHLVMIALKQAAIIVSYSHLFLFCSANDSLAHIFTTTI